MIIVGILGGIGHGKSSLAEAFAAIEPRSEHIEASDIIIEVVNAWHAQLDEVPDPNNLAEVNRSVTLLPAILQRVAHIPATPQLMSLEAKDIEQHSDIYEKLFLHLRDLRAHPKLLHTRITQSNKSNFRSILQWLGGYCVLRIDKYSWSTEAMLRAKKLETLGIKLCTIGGLRFPPQAEAVHDGGGWVVRIERPQVGEQDAGDPTERERDKISYDTTVINNASLTELRAVARQIYANLQHGKLQKQYVATDMHSRSATIVTY